MIKRICDLCTNDGEICHIARYKDADGDVVTIEAMLQSNANPDVGICRECLSRLFSYDSKEAK